MPQYGHVDQKPNGPVPGSKLSWPPALGCGFITRAWDFARVKSGVSPDAIPVGYQPAMAIGSTNGGPNAPMSWRVTGPEPAFTNAWIPSSSPRRGVVGMTLVVGSGEPTEIGIQFASMIHCSDGSSE